MSELVRTLDAVLDTALETRIVGANVLVAVDGEVAYARAAGFLDREAGKPMAPKTIFRMASVTKPFVCVAALAAVDAGKLDLAAPVTRYLPAFRPKLADGSEPVITVSQLMTHTSGLTYDLSKATRPVSAGIDGLSISMADNLLGIASAGLAFAPGAQWEYGVGIDVLGGVLEAALGQSLPEIVRASVTAPLGLTDTAFHVVDPERLAIVYADGAPPHRMGRVETVMAADGGATTFAPGRIFDRATFASGGAGMAGTAEDVLAFLEALRQGGATLLRPETMRFLTENGIGALQAREVGRRFSHGWSLFVDPAGCEEPLSAGSWGWGGVYGHQWRVDVARRMTIVSFTNTATEGCNGAFPNDVVKAAVAAVG